ncbi:MAG: TonB-dependent receptor, partial [Flavobacteriaceae bacterium]|nr:TonB-dependent receptor [Flavobacteriaceae bacterium]
MKYLLIATFSLLCTSAFFAQNIKVEGVIKDSIGEPLEFANIIATQLSTGEIESYAITNYEGRYKLNLPVNNSYLLRVSFIGYETIEESVIIAEDAQDLNKDFVLNSQASELDGVEIVYEMPVVVKGDTIVYNADSFNRGDERKLGDVMKNLPGIEVNDDGEIQVEGKTVSKVMVEGKDFFDGDSKLATKNIPADAVDKVQVLRNYNEVDQMRGLGNDQDNVAINIKLKEGKKSFWFGEVTAGAGLIDDSEEGGYLVHPKLFYYSEKYSINVITDFNNIGEVPFTFRDYFNFTGGFRNFNRGGGTRFEISESDLGFAVAQNNRANEIDTKFLAANFSWNTSPSLDISGFGILSDNRTNFVTNSVRQFIATGATETTTSEEDQQNQLGMVKLSAVYKPSTRLQIDYDVLGKLSQQEEDGVTLSQSIINGNNSIEEQKQNTPYSVNQNMNAYYTLDDKNIFAGQAQLLLQNEDPFYQAIQDAVPFRGVFTEL